MALLLSFISVPVMAEQQLYTCGMHPQIIKTEPGDCPICGMKLTPIRSNKAAGSSKATGERTIKYYKSSMIPGEVHNAPGKDTMGMDLVPVYDGEDSSAQNAIQIDAVTIQRMNLKTGLVEKGPVSRAIRTVGSVSFNEESQRDITLKYEAWLEKLHVAATWTKVKAGDPLFDVYSPDLYNAELNFVVAKKAEGEKGGPLTDAALSRLKLLDLPAEEIAAIAQSLEVPRTRTVVSPVDGVIVEKMGIVGQMMKPGERVYRLVDLSTVWVTAQVYESDLAFVQEGQEARVRLTYGSGRDYSGRVARLIPQVDEQTRTVSARIVLANEDGQLRPGMFADVHFEATLKTEATLVPEMAVLRSGERNTVFVAKDGGSFEPREVNLGLRTQAGLYEVLSGLQVGERIVTSGQFMLDSESQLREAIQKMIKGNSSSPATPATPVSVPESAKPIEQAGHDHSAHEGHSGHESMPGMSMEDQGAHKPDAQLTLYTCPMDEHADVVSDKPGRCPKCGMKMVPTSGSEHGKQSEEIWKKTHAGMQQTATNGNGS
jgi:RND family efflux transporter MFP subunit